MSQTILFPVPPPGPGPQPPAGTGRKIPTVAWLVPLVAVALVAAVVGVSWLRNPSPANDGVALGRAFSPLLAASLADGFEAAAGLVEQGKAVKDADDALKAAFLASREKAFKDHAAPAFAAVVPFDTEPKDDATRKAYVALFRDFAKGLRGTR